MSVAARLTAVAVAGACALAGMFGPAAAHAADAADAADAGPSRELPPLEAPSWMVPLHVEGFGDAMLAVPIGTRTREPLIVAMHGNFDRPEWSCGSWRAVAGPSPFILCLRGSARRDAPPSDPRWTYDGVEPAKRELRAALSAVRAVYGERLADAPMVFAGFSLGAILGVSIVSSEPGFGRAVLVEGGHDAWTPARAQQFHARGGTRVMFVCSQAGCLGPASHAAKVVQAGGAAARVVDAGRHGHSYDGEVADATRREWSWITGGLGDGG